MSHSYLFLFIVLAAIVSVPSLVLAHAELSDASPAPGSTVEQELDQVRLVFTEEVKDARITLLPQCEDCDEVYELSIEYPQPNVVVGKVKTGIRRATYNVTWMVTSLDGHSFSGTYSFVYDGPDKRINRYLIILPLVAIMAIFSFAFMLFVLRQKRQGTL